MVTLTSVAAFAADDVPTTRLPLAKTFRYRLTLRDKAHSPYSLQHPEAYLSPKAIARRQRLGIAVTEEDFPVNPAYLDAICSTGVRVVVTSKWNNTVLVEMGDTAALPALRRLSCVTDLLKAYDSEDSITVKAPIDRFADITNRLDSTDNYYGAAERQVKMLHVDALHDLGFRGQGMTIAVVDGGFHNADCLAALDDVRIMGTRNFVRPDKSVYEEQRHGMMVLSCIATNRPYVLVGTAPEAQFYLLQSEDEYWEYPAEEDNWCAAVEYADSLGCDIVTSSLGYTRCDKRYPQATYAELDGRTHLISREAAKAASHGLLVLNSAGNSGNDPWKKIGFPADADHILTVGAVTAERVNTNFSSLGHTADGRVKPDVMAMGGKAAVLGTDGCVTHANGTSFSCPIMCGAVACLWQAFPHLTPTAIIDMLHRSADNAAHTDEVYGYGIPDFLRAYQMLHQK